MMLEREYEKKVNALLYLKAPFLTVLGVDSGPRGQARGRQGRGKG